MALTLWNVPSDSAVSLRFNVLLSELLHWFFADDTDDFISQTYFLSMQLSL